MAGGAANGASVKLSQGDLAVSVTCGIWVECNNKTDNKKSKHNCAQMATMSHVEQNNERKRTLTICIEDPCEKSDVGLGSA